MKKISQICDKIGPEITGVIWFGQEEFAQGIEYFDEFNYLLDGLLVENVRTNHQQKGMHLFASSQFGHPFFVNYHNQKRYDYSELKEALQIATQMTGLKNNILILGAEELISKDMNKLKKAYPDSEFSFLH